MSYETKKYSPAESLTLAEIAFIQDLYVRASGDADNIALIGGAGGGWEVPSGTVNGSNTSFSSSNEPQVVITEAGVVIDGEGCTISGAGPYTISMVIAPQDFIIIGF